MAIFRAETKSISRGKGHNLVAAISYRAGITLTDSNTLNPSAKEYDFTKKTDVVHSEILLPRVLSNQLDAVGIELDFQSIADLVEQGETTLRGKMKNSARLGREWLLCGVPELTRAENITLFQKFAREQAEEQGVVSMCFVHDPKAGNDTRSKLGAAEATAKDERNIHAHIVLLTRQLELTPSHRLKLGNKSDSELSNDERTVGKVCPKTNKVLVKGKGLVSNSQWLKDVRKSWADILNEKLLEKNVQPVSHKSYRELGLDILPKIHYGNNESTEAKQRYNDDIDKRNRNTAAIKSAADRCIATGSRETECADTRAREAADSIASAGEWLSRAAPSPFDRKRSIAKLDEQTGVFDRFAERADRVIAKRLTALVTTAIEKYSAIRHYEPMIQHSDWSGKNVDPYPNPKPNPIVPFNERQRDMINHMHEHIVGFSGDSISHKELKDRLADYENKRILILLTDPEKEEAWYQQDKLKGIQQEAEKKSAVIVSSDLPTEAEQAGQKETVPIPHHIYTPNFSPR